MARYIISPDNIPSDDPTKDSVILIPTEGIGEKPRQVQIPKNLMPEIDADFVKLLEKMSRADVRRSKDGLVILANRVLNLNFDHFIQNCNQGVFSERYEDIYRHLRKHGVTF